MRDPDPYDPGPHSSDDAPHRAPRVRRERDPLEPPASLVLADKSLRRVARVTGCPCGKSLDLSKPADPSLHPPAETARGHLMLTYFCPDGHPGQVSTSDLTRAIRADRTGKSPAYLQGFDWVFRVVTGALRRAYRNRDPEMVASLAEKATRMIALNLKMGGILVDRVEVEHSGTVTHEQSSENVERARRRVEEIAARYGLGRVVDAEVVGDGRPPA